MSTAAYSPRPAAVLADAIPGTWARDIALVFAGALLTVLGAQISIPDPAVARAGHRPDARASSSPARRWAGSAARPRSCSTSLLGLFLPVYSDGASGIDVIWGATGGYLVGFVIAAGVIGRLAELGADRKPHLAFLAFCAGQLSIFGIGVPWLKVATDQTGPGDPQRLRDLHRRRDHQGAHRRRRHAGRLARGRARRVDA